jgi:hypothetical protein
MSFARCSMMVGVNFIWPYWPVGIGEHQRPCISHPVRLCLGRRSKSCFLRYRASVLFLGRQRYMFHLWLACDGQYISLDSRRGGGCRGRVWGHDCGPFEKQNYPLWSCLPMSRSWSRGLLDCPARSKPGLMHSRLQDSSVKVCARVFSNLACPPRQDVCKEPAR